MFVEEFADGSGGVRHAEVLFVKRLERNTFAGPLGFNGHAVELVAMLPFQAEDANPGRPELTVITRGLGAFEPVWAEAVDRTMAHFYAEQLVPYQRLTGDEDQLLAGISLLGDGGHREQRYRGHPVAAFIVDPKDNGVSPLGSEVDVVRSGDVENPP